METFHNGKTSKTMFVSIIVTAKREYLREKRPAVGKATVQTASLYVLSGVFVNIRAEKILRQFPGKRLQAAGVGGTINLEEKISFSNESRKLRVDMEPIQKYKSIIERLRAEEKVECDECHKGYWEPFNPAAKNNHAYTCNYCGAHLIIDPVVIVE